MTGELGRAGRRILRRAGLRGLVAPRYDGRSIVNLAVSAFRAAGRSGLSDRAAPLASSLDPFGGRRAEGPVVVLLVDGLGLDAVDVWAASGSTRAARWARLTEPITTVFPTTTTAALTSLSTGVAPARHGLVGYRQYLPRFGVVADLLKMTPVGAPVREQLIGPAWRPQDLSAVPSLFAGGPPSAAVTRGLFEGTGFTRLLYEGAEFVGYATGVDLAHRLASVLGRPRPPCVVYAYWDELDTIQHVRGPLPGLVRLELERVAQLIEHVAGALPPRRRRSTTLFVTGDHGQVRATRAARIRLESLPEVVREMARPLAGDRRAGFLRARAGRREALRTAVGRHLPPGSVVVPMERAVRAGLFGPPPYHPELDERLGDLLVLPAVPAGLTYLPPGAAEPTHYLLGAHGGLDPSELLVPCVRGSLSEFAGSR